MSVIDSWKGVVESINLAGAPTVPTFSVPEVKAVPGKGLEGDRYFMQTGTYSNYPGRGREVTLVEVEAIEALQRDLKVEIKPADSRRNIVTRGVPLNHLVGREFRIGGTVLRGIRLCEPCSHLESLTKKGVLEGLVHRGGLRADIVEGGMIRVGDPVILKKSS